MEENKKNKPRGLAVMFGMFFAFSLGAGIIELVSFTVLNEGVRIDYWVSYTIALILSVVYNFTINRRYTFRSVNNIPKAMMLVFLFYCAFSPYSIWMMDYLTDGALFSVGLGWNEYLVLIFIMLQNFVLEFLWWRFVVFKKSIDSRLAKVR